MPDGVASDDQEASPPDTDRLQRALDECAQASEAIVAVKLVTSSAGQDFLSGPLTIPQGVSLVLDSNVTLYASRNPADFQIAGSPDCGSVAGSGGGCRAFLSSTARNVGVQSVSATNGSVGRIDGRGGMRMWGRTQSWWDIAELARESGFQNVPRLLQTDGANNVVLSDVELRNAPGYHVYASNGDGFTAWGVRVRTPASARNTDGLDVDGTRNVTIAYSYISSGDDGIGIKASTQRTEHVSVFENHLYGTHGLSIGALTAGGVDDVFVHDNTITGVDAFGTPSATSIGVRIKSASRFGGKVENVTYSDTCIDRVLRPIDIDPFYFGLEGKTKPWFTGISITGLSAANSPSGAVMRLNGLDSDHPLGLTMSDVQVDTPNVSSSHAQIAMNGVTFGGERPHLKGVGVSVTATQSPITPPICTFPPFPNA